MEQGSGVGGDGGSGRGRARAGLTRGKVRAGDSARVRSHGARGVEVDGAGPSGTEPPPP